ncbi:MAG TPA: indole-3-glycerol phosphate synthase TrpC [Armatimonadetes bacterium]|nr:indole-3-glycerol phosphate synthase TrpC [Armatimonadota bacterium]
MILDRIVAVKREAVAAQKRRQPLKEWQVRVAQASPPLDFAAALRARPGVALIAEVKKASPSQGVLRPDFDPVALARTYAAFGAAALSVLTEESFFQGRPEFLPAIRAAVSVPLLRKDFIVDAYQIYETRALGADALLLIAAVLTPSQLRDFLALSRELGMTSLVEVHTEAELEAVLATEALVIGINNRDLGTFETDLATTGRLRPLFPPERIVVSESGISTSEHVRQLALWKVDAMLVGEALMRATNVGAKVRELLNGAG